MKTRHFMKRCQQRGISKDAIEMIELFGRESKNIGKRTSLQLKNKDVSRIQSDLKRLIRELDHLKGSQLIKSEDGSYITVLK